MLYLLSFFLVTYIALASILYFYQEKFIFFPFPLDLDYPFHQFRDFEEIFLEPEQNLRLHALYFKAAQPKGTILYFHGNTRSLNDWGYAAQDLVALGYEVLMPDYRSYGKSNGTLSEAGLKIDAQRWYDWLTTKVEKNSILLYGRSLGTGFAAHLARHNQVQQLILETPYTSLLAMAKMQVGFLPVDLLARYRMPTDQIINDIPCPIDIIHGTQDELIPYQQAVDLSQGKATLHTIQGGGHNDLAQFPEFYSILNKILN